MVEMKWLTEIRIRKGHAQDFRDRAGDTVMGRKTIPLLLPQSVARWSLAMLILAWTLGLIMLWQPPVVASAVFAATAMRCLGGYVSSHDEKDDYTSYCWYGVSIFAFMSSPSPLDTI